MAHVTHGTHIWASIAGRLSCKHAAFHAKIVSDANCCHDKYTAEAKDAVSAED